MTAFGDFTADHVLVPADAGVAAGSAAGTFMAGDDGRVRAVRAPAGVGWQQLTSYSATSTFTNVNGNGFAWPVVIPEAMTISALAVEVTTQTSSSVAWRLGWYSDSADHSVAGAKLSDLGTVDPTSTGVKIISGLSLALPSGILWFAMVMQGTGGGTAGQYRSCTHMTWPLAIGTTDPTNLSRSALQCTSVTGSLSDPWPGTIANSGLANSPVPVIAVKRSA